MKPKQDLIAALVEKSYLFHGLKTSMEREVLREMIVAAFMEEIYRDVAEKIKVGYTLFMREAWNDRH